MFFGTDVKGWPNFPVLMNLLTVKTFTSAREISPVFSFFFGAKMNTARRQHVISTFLHFTFSWLVQLLCKPIKNLPQELQWETIGLSAGTVITKETRNKTIELYSLVVLFLLLYVLNLPPYLQKEPKLFCYFFALQWKFNSQTDSVAHTVWVLSLFSFVQSNLQYSSAPKMAF